VYNTLYTVYILRTSENTFYTGQTNNIKRRIKEHKDKNPKSAKYTRRFESVELVYTEEYHTRTEAMRREWQIKQLTHKEKEKLILT